MHTSLVYTLLPCLHTGFSLYPTHNSAWVVCIHLQVFAAAAVGSAVRGRMIARFPGPTGVANDGPSGVSIDEGATNCTVGAPGSDSVTVVSGNTGYGIDIHSKGVRVLNTLVGVGADGTAPVANRGQVGVSIRYKAAGCTIGAPGNDSVTVVSGNSGEGIRVCGDDATVFKDADNDDKDCNEAEAKQGCVGWGVKRSRCLFFLAQIIIITSAQSIGGSSTPPQKRSRVLLL